MSKFIIELSYGNASLCTTEGNTPQSSGFYQDILDCTKSGDAQEACGYVLDQLGVEFWIVAKDATGQYESRLATDAEKTATCQEIYFESETDFSDQRMCELYLVWSASCEAIENES